MKKLLIKSSWCYLKAAEGRKVRHMLEERAENLVTLLPLVLRKVENLPNKLGDLAKEILN